MKWPWNRCEKHRRNINLLACGALPEDERNATETHLAACADCRRYCAELKVLTAPLKNWAEISSAIAPSQAAQMRWVREIQTASRTEQPREHLLGRVPRSLWRDFVQPARYAWAAIAAAWLLMWGLHWGLPRNQTQTIVANTETAPAIFRVLEEQRQLLAELNMATSLKPTEPPRRERSRPRTERQSEWKRC